MRFSCRHRRVRAFLSGVLSLCLLVQGCLKKDKSNGSRKGGGQTWEKRPDIQARGGIAITLPKRGFVDKPITLVSGTAPAGSSLMILDGPSVVGQGSSDQDGTFTIAVGSLGEGPHLLRADATGVGSSAIVKVTVDTVAPTVSFVETPPAVVSEPYAKFRWQASEDPALFRYTLDGQGASPFALSDRIGMNAISPGSHTFTVVARDLAGNQGQPASATFTYQPPSHEKLTNLLIVPNPFTPNGDGVEDTVTISAAMADGIAHPWTVEIKNGSGTLVQNLSGNGTSLSATWDSRDSAGVPQAVGTYQAYIMVEGISRDFSVHLANWKTGYLNQSESVLKIPAPGMPLEMNRRYRSDRADESGSFGRGGFSDILDTKITVDNRSLPVTFKTPAEQKMTFPFKREFAGATGTFKATWAAPEGHLFKDRTAPPYVIDLRNDPKDPEYVNLDLEDYRPGLFDWEQRDGDKMGFSVRNGIEYQRDPNGNEATYTPEAITHSNGRVVRLMRDEMGRITQIKDPKGNERNFSYDGDGHLQSISEGVGFSRQFAYDGSHRLTGEKVGSGVFLARYTYDSSGRVMAAQDALGQTVGLSEGPDRNWVTDRRGSVTQRVLNPDGTIARWISPMGELTEYVYDPQKRPVEIHRPLGQAEKSVYDGTFGDLIQKTDGFGKVSTLAYDSAGRPLKVSSPESEMSYRYDSSGNTIERTEMLSDGTSRTWQFSYDAVGNVLSEWDPSETVTTHAYDSKGNRVKTLLSDGRTVAFGHDANGNVLTETHTDKGNQVLEAFTYEYDGRGLPTKMSSLAGSVELEWDEFGGLRQRKMTPTGEATEVEDFERSPRGDLLSMKDSEGNRWKRVVDNDGRLLEERFNGETMAYHQYDELGRRIRTVYPDGAYEFWRYDALNRLVERGSSREPSVHIAYDAQGRVQSESTESTKRTFTYDAKGTLVSVMVTEGTGSTTTRYGSGGRVSSVTDPYGTTTSYSYDAKGNLTMVSQKGADGKTYETRYAYDERENRVSQTDAAGRTTRWTYDTAGRVSSRTLPMGQKEEFFYNSKGELIQRKRFDGSVIGYTYTDRGKLFRKTYPNGESVTWIYDDSNGNVVEILDYRGSTKHVYDSRSKLAAVVDPKNRIVNYDYDPINRVTRIGLAVGETRYGFDDQGRLSWIKDPSGKATRYTYDAVPGSRRRTRIDHGNGTGETFEYDSAGQLVRLSHRGGIGTVLRGFQYVRDAMGRVTKVVEESGRTVEYAYDFRGMLVKEKMTKTDGAVEEREYAYDEVGNRIQKTMRKPLGTVVTNYAYDANDRLLSEETSGQVTTYQYDANGNPMVKNGSGENTVYGYDFEDRLSWAQVQTIMLTFVYDPDGVRTGKTVSGLPIDYVVDKNRTYSQVVAEYRAGQLWAMVTGADMGEQGNEVISSRVGLNRYDYHHDGMNRSVRMVTDDGQNVAEMRDYDAFGNELGMNLTGWSVHPYGFAGEEFDAHLGMSYNRARYYDPKTGRFQTMDSWGGNPYDPLSLHKYIFAHNDPVNRIDPSGQFEWSLAGQLLTTWMIRTIAATFVGVGFDVVLKAVVYPGLLYAYGYNLHLSALGGDEEALGLDDMNEFDKPWMEYLHRSFLWNAAGSVVLAPFLGVIAKGVVALLQRSWWLLSRIGGAAGRGVQSTIRFFRQLHFNDIVVPYKGHGVAVSLAIDILDDPAKARNLYRLARQFFHDLSKERREQIFRAIQPDADVLGKEVVEQVVAQAPVPEIEALARLVRHMIEKGKLRAYALKRSNISNVDSLGDMSQAKAYLDGIGGQHSLADRKVLVILQDTADPAAMQDSAVQYMIHEIGHVYDDIANYYPAANVSYRVQNSDAASELGPWALELICSFRRAVARNEPLPRSPTWKLMQLAQGYGRGAYDLRKMVEDEVEEYVLHGRTSDRLRYFLRIFRKDLRVIFEAENLPLPEVLKELSFLRRDRGVVRAA